MKTSIFKDNTTLAGLIFLALSFIVFLTSVNIYEIDFDAFTGVFFVNYILVFIYFIVVLFTNKERAGAFFRFSNFTHNILLLQLFNLSAYSLNRTLPVFQVSANWVVWFLMLSNSLLVVHALWRNHRNTWFNHLLVMVSSVGVLFHLYESIYMLPLYLYGVLGFWFFGIPLHVFVPLLFVWAYCNVIRAFFKKSNQFWGSGLVAVAIAFLTVGYMSVRFYHINFTINNAFHYENMPHDDDDLPAWIKTSQWLKKDWITDRALKVGLTYSEFDDIFNSFGRIRLNERVKHDPLVMLASAFSDGINIQNSDKIQILRTLYDTRHQTERKLWNGDNLSTTDIVTNVQLFPEFRLAYTEKTFKIHNSRVQRWGSRQEALYTFYLPEGSVVTSAALWVNGKEEPAYLTTKSKADSAYTRIVGVESRDPLLLHWQEGNRVTVRVFPCTPKEDRQFKIGVTTPLRKDGNQLLYENIDFEGPYYKKAKESINIISEGKLTNLLTPYSFKEDGLNYTYFGKYKSDWNLLFDAPPLSNAAFSFNDKKVHLEEWQAAAESFSPQEIYLDINAAWSKGEFNAIWNLVKDKKVYVYSNNKMEQVRESNRRALFKQLRQQNYTLFPFYKINVPQEALHITKYNQLTPTLSDLKKSAFVQKTSDFFGEQEAAIRVLNLSDTTSPYLRSLDELRTIHLIPTNLKALAERLKIGTFPTRLEDENSLVNQYAKFSLNQSAGAAEASAAPDHLMRLFAYNSILKKIGKDLHNERFLQKQLIDEAKESYVVTPISSLVVLETQKDYDRFDIKKSENSLQNASINDSGAVPEPHEWLLILLVFIMTLWLYFKNRMSA